MRSTELRITKVDLSPQAADFLAADKHQPIRLIAHSPRTCTEDTLAQELDSAPRFVRNRLGLDAEESLCFLEVDRTDASAFEQTLCLEGRMVGNNRLLYATSPVVANSVAAILMHLERTTGHIPHAYFKWRATRSLTSCATSSSVKETLRRLLMKFCGGLSLIRNTALSFTSVNACFPAPAAL